MPLLQFAFWVLSGWFASYWYQLGGIYQEYLWKVLLMILLCAALQLSLIYVFRAYPNNAAIFNKHLSASMLCVMVIVMVWTEEVFFSYILPNILLHYFQWSISTAENTIIILFAAVHAVNHVSHSKFYNRFKVFPVQFIGLSVLRYTCLRAPSLGMSIFVHSIWNLTMILVASIQTLRKPKDKLTEEIEALFSTTIDKEVLSFEKRK
jgi:membrane protease YdiL (CAAX protease family)